MPGLFHLTIRRDFLEKGMDHEILRKNSPDFFSPPLPPLARQPRKILADFPLYGPPDDPKN
jgi:hypothetical protein